LERRAGDIPYGVVTFACPTLKRETGMGMQTGRTRQRRPGRSAWSIAAVFLIAATTGCSGVKPRKKDSRIDVPVVDVHTHAFNARDLPISGILQSTSILPQGVPPRVADGVAAALIFWTPDDDGGRTAAEAAGDLLSGDSGRNDPKQVAADIRRRIEAKAKATANRKAPSRTTAPGAESATATGASIRDPKAPLLAPLTPEQRAAVKAYAGVDTAKLDAQMVSGPPDLMADQVNLLDVAGVLARTRFLGNPTEPNDAVDEHSKVDPSKLGNYIRFIYIITRSHYTLARLMTEQEYPEGRLFVHHMMDMAHTYANDPSNPFDVQTQDMACLDEAMKGRLVHFVAFDPFRGNGALEYVKRGLERGAIGVKFYPPSGYSAADNEVEPVPDDSPSAVRRWRSRHGDVDPAEAAVRLNAQVKALFDYCEKNQIPIFTHCTTDGFQAEAGYGAKSDPKFWASALHDHPNLRLCFGHSGGKAFWFPKPGASDDAARYGKQVVDLCNTYRYVYCESGYMAGILDQRSLGVYRDRLASVLDRDATPADGGPGWKFGDKYMYGTDWFMIAQENNPQDYLRNFWTAFEDQRLARWRRAFFGRNAVHFLRLAEVAADKCKPFKPAQRSYWNRLVEEVERK
jgi:predicted TIM-barrel fold metal-dependent hydrolase